MKLKKSEINRLIKDIKARKKALFHQMLSDSSKNIEDLIRVKTILDESADKDETLSRLEATAALVLQRYLKVSAKGRLRLTADDLRDGPKND